MKLFEYYRESLLGCYVFFYVSLQSLEYCRESLLGSCLIFIPDFCTQLEMDEVALTLATFNKSLKCLHAWKTHNLTARGLRALACISTLQDLDLGWA